MSIVNFTPLTLGIIPLVAIFVALSRPLKPASVRQDTAAAIPTTEPETPPVLQPEGEGDLLHDPPRENVAEAVRLTMPGTLSLSAFVEPTSPSSKPGGSDRDGEATLDLAPLDANNSPEPLHSDSSTIMGIPLADRLSESHGFWKKKLRKRIHRLRKSVDKLRMLGEDTDAIIFRIELINEYIWISSRNEAELQMDKAVALYNISNEQRMRRGPLRDFSGTIQARGPRKPVALRIRGAAQRENMNPESQAVHPTTVGATRGKPFRSLASVGSPTASTGPSLLRWLKASRITRSL